MLSLRDPPPSFLCSRGVTAFYANVEMKDNPSLRGKPMAVGGMAMLSTANYEARCVPCPPGLSALSSRR